MPRVDVPDYGTYVDFPDGTPPEQMQSVLSQNFPQKRGIVDAFKGAGARVAQGINSSLGSVSKTFGLDAGAKNYQQGVDYWKKVADEAGSGGIPSKVYEGIGGAPVGLAEFTAGVPYAATKGAVEGYRQDGLSGAAKGAALQSLKRFAVGRIFHGIENANLSPVAKSATMAGTMGAQTAAEGGNLQDVIASTLTGAAIAPPGVGSGKSEAVRSRLMDAGATPEIANDLSSRLPEASTKTPALENVRQPIQFTGPDGKPIDVPDNIPATGKLMKDTGAGQVTGGVSFNHDDLPNSAVTGADSLELQKQAPKVKPVVKMTIPEIKALRSDGQIPPTSVIHTDGNGNAYIIDPKAVQDLYGLSKMDSIKQARIDLKDPVKESALLGYPNRPNIKGWYTERNGEKSLNMTLPDGTVIRSGGAGAGLPLGQYIALDKPFVSEWHSAEDAKPVSANVDAPYDPQGLLGEPTPNYHNEFIDWANKNKPKDNEQAFTDFLKSKGYDSYVRLIDGQIGNRELIVFDRDKVTKAPVTAAVTKQGEVVTDPQAIVDHAQNGNVAWSAEGKPEEVTQKAGQVSDVLTNNLYQKESPFFDKEDSKFLLTNPSVKEDGYGVGTEYEVKEPNGDTITVYRAVPNGINDIKPGDYVTASKKYAEDHLSMHTSERLVENRNLVDGGKIISKDIPKDELVVYGANELVWKTKKEIPNGKETNNETSQTAVPPEGRQTTKEELLRSPVQNEGAVNAAPEPTMLNSGINAIEAAKKAMEIPAVSDTVKTIKDWFSPLHDASTESKDALFKAKGEAALETAKAKLRLDNISKEVSRWTDADRVAFIDATRTGNANNLTGTPRELFEIGDSISKSLVPMVQQINPDFKPLADHAMLTMRYKERPGSEGDSLPFYTLHGLEGSKAFTKRRSDQTVQQLMEQGYVPKETNPVRVMLDSIQDMMKYVTAGNLAQEGKDSGRWQFVRNGVQPPSGYAKLNDRMTDSYRHILYPEHKSFSTEGYEVVDGQNNRLAAFKDEAQAQDYAQANSGTVKQVDPKSMFVKSGEWYLPQGEARALNNYLSRDQIKGHSLGKALVNFKDQYTALELGMSGFHAVTMANETVASRLGLAVQQVVNGDIDGLKRNLSSPESAWQVLGLAKEYMKDPEGFTQNSKTQEMMQKIFGKDAEYMGQVVKAYFDGGGLLESQYRGSDVKFLDRIRHADNGKDKVIGAVKMAHDAFMIPTDFIFNNIVPSAKFSMFALQYAHNMKIYSDRIATGEMTETEVARKTVASIENRFGEMNWDNFYFNKTFKTALRLLFRSPTWQMGNWREIGGAPIEQLREIKRAIAKGERPVLDQKTSWLLSLTAMHIAQSTLIGYGMAAATGDESLKPKQWFDYIFPKISAMTRISIPGYLKEPISLVRSMQKGRFYLPVDYVQSKLSGYMGKLAEVWRNKDFYGTQITDPEADIKTQARQAATHILPQPFSFRSMYDQYKQGDLGAAQAITSLMGFTKAPSWVDKSNLEEFIGENTPRSDTTVSPEDKARRVLTNSIANKILSLSRLGKPLDPAINQLRESISSGKLRDEDLDKIDEMLSEPKLVRQFKRLSYENAIKGFVTHARPEEREQLKEVFLDKMDNFEEKHPEEFQKMMPQIKKAIDLLKGGK